MSDTQQSNGGILEAAGWSVQCPARQLSTLVAARSRDKRQLMIAKETRERAGNLLGGYMCCGYGR